MSMIARQIVILVVLGASFSSTIVYMSRHRALSYRYTLGWLFFGLIIMVSAIPLFFLKFFANLLGVSQLNIGLLALGMVSVLISVEISLTLSKIANRQRELGLHIALASGSELLSPGDTNTLVIIPALNEEESIGSVVRDCQQAGYVCLVIDDGSIDKTGVIATELGAYVLTAPFNLGIGVALRAGFVWAVQNGFSRVVQCDADGQHSPASIRALLQLQDETNAHLVVGSRFAGDHAYEVNFLRRLMMILLAHRAAKACDQKITDASSGFRCISNELLVEFARNYPTDYMDSYEALIGAGNGGYSIREVFTPMQKRLTGTPSNNVLSSAFHTIKVLSTGHLGTPYVLRKLDRST